MWIYERVGRGGGGVMCVGVVFYECSGRSDGGSGTEEDEERKKECM